MVELLPMVERFAVLVQRDFANDPRSVPLLQWLEEFHFFVADPPQTQHAINATLRAFYDAQEVFNSDPLPEAPAFFTLRSALSALEGVLAHSDFLHYPDNVATLRAWNAFTQLVNTVERDNAATMSP